MYLRIEPCYNIGIRLFDKNIPTEGFINSFRFKNFGVDDSHLATYGEKNKDVDFFLGGGGTNLTLMNYLAILGNSEHF